MAQGSRKLVMGLLVDTHGKYNMLTYLQVGDENEHHAGAK